MSISAVGGSSVFGLSFDSSQWMNSSGQTKQSPDDFAASIVERDDTDGDGLLSLAETPLDEDRFNSIDADGDGYISAEELSADAQARMDEQNALMGQLAVQMQSTDASDLAASIVEKDDADGDGVLSLDETPLDEERFNSIDTDGDGFISAEELSADLQANAAQDMPAPPPGAEPQASAASASGTESEEEYDELDLNKDGVVSFDELLQAYGNGNGNWTSLFQGTDDTTSSLTSRYAIRAYQAQIA